MPDFSTSLVQFLGSSTFGVILSLLIIFQWYKQHAKEQAVKNSLFAIRRKTERRINDQNFTPETAYDMVDDIDAILATLGARKPFQETLGKVLGLIGCRNNTEESNALIDTIPNGSSVVTPLLISTLKTSREDKKMAPISKMQK